MFTAKRNHLSIFISGEGIHVEIFVIAFPSFYGDSCGYYSIVKHQKDWIDRMLKVAQEICDRFNQDKRDDVTSHILKKAFNRSI